MGADARRPESLLPIITILGLTCLAGLAHFVLDDAFISFRYAESLAAGEGLVYNPGEWVEGYTNFLWTVWLAIPFLLGIDPIVFAHTSSLACFAGCLWLTYRLATRILDQPHLGWVAMVLTGTNATFLAYGTSGLETELQALLVLYAATLVLEGPRTSGRAAWLSVIFALSLMTRLDSGIAVALLGGYALLQAARAKAPSSRYVALILPGALCVGAWFGWKVLTYGDILPNTFYAKVSGTATVSQGLGFLGLFILSYGLFLWPVAGLVALRKLRRAGAVGLLALLVLVWSVYVVTVGGDFMEFRFMVPVLPAMMIVVTWLAFRLFRPRWLSIALSVTVVLGSIAHALFFKTTAGVESIDDLATHLTRPVQDWEGIGRRLASDLPAGSDVKIATTAAGAIPYYSKLPTLDLLGLTDRWVARHGRVYTAQRNHARMAPPEYIARSGVHLLLGQPRVELAIADRKHYMFRELRKLHVFPEGYAARDLPKTARVLEIPLDDSRVLMALYLRPHTHIEELVKAGRWRRYRIGLARRGERL